MSDFKAKMHQNRIQLGLCPRPLWGSLQRFLELPSWNKVVLLLRKGEWCGEGEREGRVKEGRDRNEEEGR